MKIATIATIALLSTAPVMAADDPLIDPTQMAVSDGWTPVQEKELATVWNSAALRQCILRHIDKAQADKAVNLIYMICRAEAQH